MYKVIRHFTDLQDKNRPYNVGDIFPREGLKVAEERLTELAGSNNKRGIPLIEKVEEKKEPAKKSVKKASAKKKDTSEK